MSRKVKIVTLTGGTGGYQLLRGLVDNLLPQIELTAVIGSADNGGAQRRFVVDMGFLPTSDILQAMLAVAPEPWRSFLHMIFSYRFQKERLVGLINRNMGELPLTPETESLLQSLDRLKLGNIIMMSIADILGSEERALREINQLLPANIYPATYMKAELVATYLTPTGPQMVEGENAIDEPVYEFQHDSPIVSLGYSVPVKAVDEVLDAISEADMIVIGPGDVYTSNLQPIVVPGVADAIIHSNALVVLVSNLMTKVGQTWFNGKPYAATEHLVVYQQYLRDAIDVVIVHQGPRVPPEVLGLYSTEHAEEVIDDLGDMARPIVYRADVMSPLVFQAAGGDMLNRSIVRHDRDKLAQVIAEIIKDFNLV